MLIVFSFGIDKTQLKKTELHLKQKLKRIENGTNLRSQILWMPYGDQVFVIPKEAYLHVGGFHDYKLMEDFDLIARVREKCFEEGRDIAILEEQALCSPRRWIAKGTWKTTLINWYCVFAFVMLGTSPDSLYRFYYRK